MRAVEVAGILDPGVPNVRTIGQPRLVLALKSGNFGSGDALASQPLAPAISRSSTLDGNALNRSRPSKESPFHLAIYRAVAERAGAVVHLHSTHAVALACLQASPRSRWCLISAPAPPSSLLPSARPQREHDCMLLRNHGLVAAGRTIEVAADRAEELDLSARLFFLLRGEQVRALSPADRDEIARFFRRA